jgi:CHAT domain-containing protein
MVLAGCSSLSVTDAGTGEWWGLATGLLWQGSSHVVGSAWKVRTVQDTEDFVADLARELRTTDDPALSLRRLQLDRYRRWEATGSPLPYEWAGWSIVSAGTAR